VHPKKACRECLLGARCAYGYLFETPISPDATVMRRYTHAPHPFVLCPPPNGTCEADSGTSIALSLILFGRAIDHFPYVLLGLLRLGELGLGVERVTFDVEAMASAPDGQVIYTGQKDKPVLPPPPRSIDASVRPPKLGRFRLHLLTPMRIRLQDKVLRRPEFAPLVSAALRRLELLCRVHEAGVYELDGEELVRSAQSTSLVRDETRWHDLSRYSKRQDHRMPLGGIVGTATFEGDFGTLQELMSLAGKVHVGKGTAFGHGLFRMEPEDHGAEIP